MSFVHLHNHTHYSLTDASLKPKELVLAAVNAGQPAVALTDHGVMFGTIEFYSYCLENKIKPIIGIEAYIASGSRFSRGDKNEQKSKSYYHIILLAKDLVGYRNLCKLTSISFTEGFYRKPRIDKEVLELYKEGLICTTACMGGIVNAFLHQRDYETAKNEAIYYKELFGDDFYFEIQRHKYENEEQLIYDTVKLAKELDIKLICTNDIHYLKKEHAEAHNVLLNIGNPKKNYDLSTLRYGTNEFYFKTSEEMRELFSDYPESIENTLEIMNKCNLEIPLGNVTMPTFPIPADSKATNLDEYLIEITYKGLANKFEDNIIPEEYLNRAKYELDLIIKMKFPGYFLIVQDLINSAKALGVPVGPGRGSAAGSLVAYAVGITNVDPIKYALLFERFLNPDRVNMPDIDIDFCDENRSKVLQYISDKYGKNSVAQIVTFSTLSCKAVLTDVGRVMEIPLDEVKKITSIISNAPTKIDKLEDALKLDDLEWLIETDDLHLKKYIEICKILEGTVRGRGTHAAGVIIAPSDIVNFIPTCTPLRDKINDESTIELVTQYSNTKSAIERCGLLKMDILGLQTLSIIAKTLKLIEYNYNISIDLDKIDLEDKKTFELLGRGETNAIFQFESSGMQEYLKQLKPQSIYDLTAMNALYRPGPIKNIPEFIDRKLGRKAIEYLHPIMENVLKQTYGIIVYQEQVMELVQVIGDFSLGEADILRRNMSKKDPTDMLKMKPKFIEGALQKGISKDVAEQIFDLIHKFADYGFNKSHSAAYSLVAFQTAWLKAHYPAEFIAANMTAEMLKPDKLAILINEAKNLGLKILPTDVNRSFAHFHAQGNSIYYGMAGIRNLGINVVESIIEARNEAPFKSFFDFCIRVDKKAINKRSIEALIYSGAFDMIADGKRASLLASYELAMDYQKAVEAQASSNNFNLFCDANNTPHIEEPKLIETEEWSELDKLLKEKEYMTFCLSGNPYKIFEKNLKMLSKHTIKDIYQFSNKAKVKIGCFLSDVISKRTKDNNVFYILKLEDDESFFEAKIGSKRLGYNNNQSKLVKNTPVFIVGSVSNYNDNISVNVEDIYSLEEALVKFGSGYKIFINVDNSNNDKLKLIKNMTSNICVENKELVFSLYSTRNDFRREYTAKINIETNTENFRKLQDIFNPENVKFIINT